MKGVALFLALAAGCAAPEKPALSPRPFSGDARASLEWTQRRGAHGAATETDLDARTEVSARVRDTAAEGVGAALTVRAEGDLDGSEDYDPLGDLANSQDRGYLVEVIRAFVEAPDLLDRRLGVRVGRQSLWAGGRSWRLDGAQLDARARDVTATLFGGYRARTFSLGDDDELFGAALDARPGAETRVSGSLVHFLADRAVLEASQGFGRGIEARAALSALDDRHDRTRLALAWRPEGPPGQCVEVEARYLRQSARAAETVPFDDTDRTPGTGPTIFTRRLNLPVLDPYDEYALDGAIEIASGLEFEAGLLWRDVASSSDRDLYDTDAGEFRLGADLRDPLGIGVSGSLRWRHRDARLPSRSPPDTFVDPQQEGEESGDEVLGEIRWRWRERARIGPMRAEEAPGPLAVTGLEAGVSGGWRRFDYRSRFGRLHDLDGWWVTVAVEARVSAGAWLRLAFTHEDDFGLLDGETKDLQTAAVEAGVRW